MRYKVALPVFLGILLSAFYIGVSEAMTGMISHKDRRSISTDPFITLHALEIEADWVSTDRVWLDFTNSIQDLVPKFIINPYEYPSGSIVSGTVSGTWNSAGSPYTAIGDITIPQGEELTIQAGVEVRLAAGVKLVAEGDLLAMGEAGSPVIFTSDQLDPQPGDWGWLEIYSDGTRLRYVTVEYGIYGIMVKTEGGIIGPVIEHSLIRYNERDGIRIRAQSRNGEARNQTQVLNSTITQNSPGIFIAAYGASIVSYAEPIIRNNTITQNRGNGIWVNGEQGWAEDADGIALGEIVGNTITENEYDGILIRGGGGEYGCIPSPCIAGTANPKVLANYIAENGFDGITVIAVFHEGLPYRGYASPLIANNVIVNNTQSGIEVSADHVYESASPRILNNTIVSNTGMGIELPERVGFGLAIFNNLMVSNTVGIQAKDDYFPDLGCNDMWENGTNLEGFPSSYGDITTTNPNGDPSDIYFNIFLKPHFVDAANLDFHLAGVSPAIDAGCSHDDLPTDDFDGDNRQQGKRIDIGADEVQGAWFIQNLPLILVP
jgi:hypothetical protein